MGAVLSSEPGTSAQGEVAIIASQNPLSGCRGKGGLPSLGMECAEEQHRMFGGPCRHWLLAACQVASEARASGAQPEGGGRRRVQSGAQEAGQIKCPTLT